MEVIQSELEILHVAKSVGLSFEGFDFVVDPLDHGTGNGVFEIVEQAGSVCGKGLGNFDEMLNPGLERVLAPCFEECFCSVPIHFVPEEPELLLH